MKFLFLLLTIFITSFLQAQQISIYITPGIMNYAGDLQTASYTLSQSNICMGAGVNFRVNHFLINASIVKGSVEANDKYNSGNSRRNLNFKSDITEASVHLQYDFIDISAEKKLTPYLFAGIGLAHFNPYTYDASGIKTYLQPLGTEGEGLAEYPYRTLYNLTEFCIPVGIGIKYKLNDNFTLGIEYNSRFLNSDYLDDVSKTYPNQQALFNARGAEAVNLSFRTTEIFPNAVYPDDKQRGNPNQKDNFYTSVFKLSYTFAGTNHKGARTRSGNIRCPRKVY